MKGQTGPYAGPALKPEEVLLFLALLDRLAAGCGHSRRAVLREVEINLAKVLERVLKQTRLSECKEKSHRAQMPQSCSQTIS